MERIIVGRKELNIDENWTFKDIVDNVWALRDEYDRLLMSFSYFELHKKVIFLRHTRDAIYALDFEEWRKDKIWDYMNHYEYFTTLRDMANRMK